MLILIAIFAMVFLALPQRICIAVDRSEAQHALSNAEKAVVSAYLAVAEAESVGANVSGLIFKLQVAAYWLAKANNALRLGNYDEAQNFAKECVETVEGVQYEAKILMEEAERSRSERLFLSAGWSSVGLSFLFVFSLFGWRRLRRFYVKRVLKMKPEVIGENESGRS